MSVSDQDLTAAAEILKERNLDVASVQKDLLMSKMGISLKKAEDLLAALERPVSRSWVVVETTRNLEGDTEPPLEILIEAGGLLRSWFTYWHGRGGSCLACGKRARHDAYAYFERARVGDDDAPRICIPCVRAHMAPDVTFSAPDSVSEAVQDGFIQTSRTEGPQIPVAPDSPGASAWIERIYDAPPTPTRRARPRSSRHRETQCSCQHSERAHNYEETLGTSGRQLVRSGWRISCTRCSCSYWEQDPNRYSPERHIVIRSRRG